MRKGKRNDDLLSAPWPVLLEGSCAIRGVDYGAGPQLKSPNLGDKASFYIRMSWTSPQLWIVDNQLKAQINICQH